jgi:hypothetical protein
MRVSVKGHDIYINTAFVAFVGPAVDDSGKPLVGRSDIVMSNNMILNADEGLESVIERIEAE